MNPDSATSDAPWLVAFCVTASLAPLVYFAPPTPFVEAAAFFALAAFYFFLVYATAPAEYRRNWLRHLLASFMGEGLSSHLARDFTGGEDLWNLDRPVAGRWRRLLAAYTLCAGSQLVLPVGVIGFGLLAFGKTTLNWVGFVMVGSAVFGILLALVFATWEARRWRMR